MSSHLLSSKALAVIWCMSTYVLLMLVCCIDLCDEAGSSCNGGQSVINPWFIIGGVATSVCKKSDFIM